MYIEIAIIKYILIDFILAKVVAVIAAPNVLAISKRVKGVVVEWGPL